MIDIDFDRAFAVWAEQSRWSPAEIKTRFRFDAPYQQHERGEIPASEYFDHLATTLQLSGDPAHMAAWSSLYPTLVSSFDKVFASHQMGMRKPELEAFHHIAREIGADPAAILFFDDLLENVEGAIAAGLQAVCVRSPQDVRDALSGFGYTR